MPASPQPSPTTVASQVFDGHCGAADGQIFPPDAPWNRSVRTACVDPNSQAVIDYLQAVVSSSQTFRIDQGTVGDDYGFNLLAADAGVGHQPFTPRENENLFYRPHCDEALVPVVNGGRLEGEAAYTCTSGGDCHLLVYDTASCQLFEMWKADDVQGNFAGGCLAVWDTSVTPGSDLRGSNCTSADAAGLPISALLVTPGEVKSGEIRHALRFILPNAAVARNVYARPATHNPLTDGSPMTGPTGTTPPPYGVRLRLKDSFDTSALPKGARVMAEALKEYGMFHADGGDVTFIASNDTLAAAKWDDADVDLGPNDLRDAGIQWTDFEVVSDLNDLGDMSTGDCMRTPLDEF